MASTAQIGKAGELLVQLRLLMAGIDSSPMTTDAGVDLVAYSPGKRRAKTIQVKTNKKAKPGGGKGKLALDWWIPDSSPAQYFALVDLRSSRIWLLTMAELRRLAQQHPPGRYHIYMYVEATTHRLRTGKRMTDTQFSAYLLESRLRELR